MTDRLAELALNVYTIALPLSWIAVGSLILVALPLSLFRGSRGSAGKLFFQASFLFGFTTWLLGAAITFGTYGWLGLFIGMMIFGVGVVPLAILAAIVTLKSGFVALTLLAMVGITLGCRIIGAIWMESAEQAITS